MNPLKNKKRIKTIIALGIALLATTTISPHLFIANSPQINTQFIAEIQNTPQNFMAFFKRAPDARQVDAIASLNEARVDNTPEGLQLYPVAKGVQASEDGAMGQRYVKVDAGTELTAYTITLDDGRVVTVYMAPE